MSDVNITVDLTSHLDEVLSATKQQIENGLWSVGSTAEGYAKDECPVDTGRLRASITHATKENPGAALATPEEGAVYIGSNVEYAEKVETGEYAHKVGNAHFLKNAVQGHADEYKNILEAALKAE